jgi:uncharacterized membrane protein
VRRAAGRRLDPRPPALHGARSEAVAREGAALVTAVREHLQHHLRFYGAGVFGVLVFLAAPPLDPSLHLVVAGDGFFAAYLLSSAWVARGATPQYLRRRASYEDEGVQVIILLTLLAIALCMAAIFSLLGEAGNPGPLPLVLALASVLLGWLTLHTVAAFRYAHLYYTPAPPASGGPKDAGGLAFPGTDEPGPWDFLYYSLVIGMTSQVSDVQTTSSEMRRTTLAHSITSFFFNTVILALAVNVAASFTP